ncbi:MAG: GspH/FimT family pseudopilin [Sedimentisphaerales bacterium]|jgi:prepilin-type N-terminal cleavage/methylation domain-containing protein|nr:GspH/FimT family pseudopilin [Sedimentisphaerales bacterium]
MSARVHRVITKRPVPGLTLVELMMVIVLLAIAAMLAVPMLGSSAVSKVQAAAQALTSDLEYARNLAMTHGRIYAVCFDLNEPHSYKIQDPAGQVIEHPVNKGPYLVRFAGPLDGVRFAQVNIAGTCQVRFDHTGRPYDGSGQGLEASGLITLQIGRFSETVEIEPETGFIRIR